MCLYTYTAMTVLGRTSCTADMTAGLKQGKEDAFHQRGTFHVATTTAGDIDVLGLEPGPWIRPEGCRPMPLSLCCALCCGRGVRQDLFLVAATGTGTGPLYTRYSVTPAVDQLQESLHCCMTPYALAGTCHFHPPGSVRGPGPVPAARPCRGGGPAA